MRLLSFLFASFSLSSAADDDAHTEVDADVLAFFSLSTSIHHVVTLAEQSVKITDIKMEIRNFMQQCLQASYSIFDTFNQPKIEYSGIEITKNGSIYQHQSPNHQIDISMEKWMFLQMRFDDK